MRKAALAASLLAPVPGQALTPLVPCSGVVEAGMSVYDVQPLGRYDAASGAVVENYANAVEVKDTIYVARPAPTPQLDGFSGARVTFCPTGDFIAIPGEDASAVSHALAATEFLRADVKSGRKVSFPALRRAARAVYGDVVVLRETTQTCACAAFYPQMKPAGMTRFEDRTDVER